MGFGPVLFAQFTLRVGTGHIEIAKDHMCQSVAGTKIAQDIFDGALGRTIGVDRVLWRVFVQHNAVLIAVGRAG